MDFGNWVPISKAFADSLPKTRKFSELEAMYSLQLDFDNDVEVTILGCSSRWGWSRDKVKKFFIDKFVKLEYEKDTKIFKKQKGKLKKTLNQQQIDIKPALKKYKRFIDNSEEQLQKNIKPTLNQQQNNNKPVTTIEPNTKPETKNNKKLFVEDSKEFRLANFLYQNILKNKPDHKKPNLQKWASEADRMLRIDKRNIETCKRLIVWVQSDDFEKCNVLSMSKLKKRFDNLEMKMNKPSNGYQQKEKSLTEIVAEARDDKTFDFELTDFEEVR